MTAAPRAMRWLLGLLVPLAAAAAPHADLEARVAEALAAHPEVAAEVEALRPLGATRDGRPRFRVSAEAVPLVLQRVVEGRDDHDTRAALLAAIVQPERAWLDDLALAYDLVDGDLRAVVVQLAVRERQGASAPLVLRALRDPSPRARAAAARVAPGLPGVGVDALVPLLGDVAPEVRAAAARGLGVVGAPVDADRLRPLLADDAPEVRLAALSSVARLTPARLAGVLDALLADPDARVRARAEALAEGRP